MPKAPNEENVDEAIDSNAEEEQDDTETTENEDEEIDIELKDDEEVEDTDEDTDDQDEPEEDEKDKTIKSLKIQKAKLKEKYEKLKNGSGKKTKSDSSADRLSSKDMYALIKADVHEDDIDEVADFAKFKKISIPEALKNGTVRNILKTNEAKRNAKSATNTGSQRRTTQKVSDEQLVRDSQSGKLPDSDDDINRLVDARLARRGKR